MSLLDACVIDCGTLWRTSLGHVYLRCKKKKNLAAFHGNVSILYINVDFFCIAAIHLIWLIHEVVGFCACVALQLTRC